MCSACWDTLAASLGAVEWLSVEVDVTLSRQDRTTAAGAGVVTHVREEPLPFHLGASDRAHQLRNALTTWVRDLHDLHAVRWQECDRCSARWLSGERLHDVEGCTGEWVERVDPLVVSESERPTSVDLARWLQRHPSWIKTHPAAGELHDQLTDAVTACWRVIDTPRDTRVFLGICGYEDGECRRELFVSRHSSDEEVICPDCGEVWSVKDRREWMLFQVEDEVGTAALLSAVLTRLGLPVTVGDIQALGKTGAIVAVKEDRNRRRLYRAGEVMDAVIAARQKVAS
jgi:hypothetical protein